LGPRTVQHEHAYDVVVVGGRVAGALTACLFAQLGQRVVVLDRARFPSATLSTHFFRGDGLIRVMGRAGVLDDVLALGSPPLTCEYAYVDGGTDAERCPPQDPGEAGFCLSVRREPLDQTLLEAARGAGAEVLTGSRVVSVARVRGRVVGVRLADGSEVKAGLVVGADGRSSLVAADVGAVDRERHEGRRALYYRYVADMRGPDGDPADGPEFSLLGDELAYVFPSDAGMTCVAISVNVAEYSTFRHNARDRFEAMLRRHKGIWERYADSRRDDRLFGSGPQDDYVRQAAGPGWALVGDAGLHQDPWSGLGMDCAGLSAQALVDTYTVTGSTTTSAAAYEQTRNDMLLDGFHETVRLAADLSVL
jgi:flavin-dependent dehydrogenase